MKKRDASTENKIHETQKDKKMRISDEPKDDSPKNRRESQAFTCQYCQESFVGSNKGNYLRHEQFCAKYVKFIDGNQCLICKLDLKNRGKVRYHMRTKHKDEGIEKDNAESNDKNEGTEKDITENRDGIIPGNDLFPGTGIPGNSRKNSREFPGIQNSLYRSIKSLHFPNKNGSFCNFRA